MSEMSVPLMMALALLGLNLLLVLVLLLRKPDQRPHEQAQQALRQELQAAMQQGNERLERELRRELAETARTGRQESAQTLGNFQGALVQHAAESARGQAQQLDVFAQQLVRLQQTVHDTLHHQLDTLHQGNQQRMTEVRQTLDAQISQLAGSNTQQLEQVRTLVGETLQTTLQARLHENAQLLQQQMQGVQAGLAAMQQQVSETLTHQINTLSEANARRLQEMRATLETQLAHLQQTNTAKLDEMRQTVDEKLQSTLHQRLGESFRQVAERLELVHRGLGEMQTLAQGVGDLKHLLTNVKTRGMFGEAQLGALLEQVFAPDQYAAQVQVHPASRHAVDFAIRLPGKSDDGTPLWLPIDAKFPNEDYERLLVAQQQADAEAAELAARQLEARIRLEAKSIAERYVAPPHTTDFAILFLPTEGLYAEVLRRPGLMEALQREHHVTLAGPTTLLAMLNSLQMGFRTLALEKRSSEVWQVLGAVKTEFGKFGDVLAKVKKQTQTMLNTLDEAERRNRAMHRSLRSAEALPEPQAQDVLGLLGADAASQTPSAGQADGV